MANSLHGKITEHVFFADVNWSEAEQGRLCPPFIPKTVCEITGADHLPLTVFNRYLYALQKSVRDTSNFEDVFTAEKKHRIDLDSSTSSDNFVNFDYTNPNMTD